MKELKEYVTDAVKLFEDGTKSVSFIAPMKVGDNTYLIELTLNKVE